MSEHEKPLETLEEKFVRLREEGLSDKEILKAVFEENLDADIDELVRITGMTRLDIGRIKGNVSRSLKSRQAKEAKEPTEPSTPYKGPVDATLILREILGKHPDIPAKVVEEILSWAEYGPIHPTQLVYLLQSMRGIQSTTANIVAQKYSLALQKAQQEGKLQIPPPMYSPQFQPQWGSPFMGVPQQPQMPQMPQMPYQPPLTQFPTQYPTSQQPTPFGWPGQRLYSQEDLTKAREDAQREERLKKVEEASTDISKNVSDLMEKLPGMISDATKTEGGGYVEERTPLDAKGKPTTPDKAVSIRVKRTPVAERGKDLLDQVKDLKDAGLITTPKDMMEMLEKRKPTTTESVDEHPMVKELKERGEKLEEKLEKEREERLKVEREMREKDEERRHTETLEAIKSIRQPMTGVTTTEGVLATAITEAGRIAEKKEPIRVIVEAVAPPGVSASKPQSEKAGEAERGGVLQQLAREGLAVRVLERVRH